MRNDKLVLRTDEEEFLYAGWDYGAPYSLDPLNGVSVDLKTAQSVNQIGSTVEQQSVAGVYRELIIDFWGTDGEAQAKKFLDALPYLPKGLCTSETNGFAVSCSPRPPTQSSSSHTPGWTSCCTAKSPSGTT